MNTIDNLNLEIIIALPYPLDDHVCVRQACCLTKSSTNFQTSHYAGLVSNLSNSFSKWRRDSKGHNQSNISDKSTMSVMSVADKSSILVTDCVDGGYVYEYETNPLCPEATPKLMRKRKAEDEVVPFSASKK